MNAIENIKCQISKKYQFMFNTAHELPELSWVYDLVSRYHKDAEEAIKRMKDSHLFTKEEMQDIANYAEQIITKRGMCARNILKEMKREQFIF